MIGPKIFDSTKCARCGGLKLDRPDRLPLCSDCEAKFCGEFAEKIRPDLADKKQVLNSDHVTEQ